MRDALHRMADWAADYRETIEDRTIVPAVAPGELTARIPASPPDRGEPLERILGDDQHGHAGARPAAPLWGIRFVSVNRGMAEANP